jgi:hypothetical protein
VLIHYWEDSSPGGRWVQSYRTSPFLMMISFYGPVGGSWDSCSFHCISLIRGKDQGYNLCDTFHWHHDILIFHSISVVLNRQHAHPRVFSRVSISVSDRQTLSVSTSWAGSSSNKYAASSVAFRDGAPEYEVRLSLGSERQHRKGHCVYHGLIMLFTVQYEEHYVDIDREIQEQETTDMPYRLC